MTDPAVPTTPRPVVDAAKSESRNQRIVAAVLAVLVFIPRVLDSFNIYEFNVDQLSDFTTAVTLLAAVVLVFMAEGTKSTALYVETQVTSTFEPVKTTTTPG